MKTYIMRWNPGISSAKIEDFRTAREKWTKGFQSNWSIYEWKEAKEGDEYYMIRVGEGPNGVVYMGHFLSNPYKGEDWAGDPNKIRHYVNISIEIHSDPDEPMISIEQLEAVLPEIEWSGGHSGMLLTPKQAEILHKYFPLR
ncbi:MAG: hypothetical protein ACI4UO_07090 [Paludibacteraceae bacterium]